MIVISIVIWGVILVIIIGIVMVLRSRNKRKMQETSERLKDHFGGKEIELEQRQVDEEKGIP